MAIRYEGGKPVKRQTPTRKESTIGKPRRATGVTAQQQAEALKRSYPAYRDKSYVINSEGRIVWIDPKTQKVSADEGAFKVLKDVSSGDFVSVRSGGRTIPKRTAQRQAKQELGKISTIYQKPQAIIEDGRVVGYLGTPSRTYEQRRLEAQRQRVKFNLQQAKRQIKDDWLQKIYERPKQKETIAVVRVRDGCCCPTKSQ